MSRIRDLRVGTKLTAAFFGLCLLLIAVAAVASVSLSSAQSRFSDLYHAHLKSTAAIGDVATQFVQVRLDGTGYVLGQTPADFAVELHSVTWPVRGGDRGPVVVGEQVREGDRFWVADHRQ